VGTFNLSAKYLSKKDSATMLPELTEFVPAIRMGIVRKVLLGKSSHDNLKEGFTSFFYLSSRNSIGVHAKKSTIS
jgi:hypothetical protein